MSSSSLRLFNQTRLRDSWAINYQEVGREPLFLEKKTLKKWKKTNATKNICVPSVASLPSPLSRDNSRAAFGLLKKILNYLPLKQRLLYYNALIRPVINYVSVLWTNCNKESLERVLKLQKRAARVMMNAHPQAPSVPLFNRLNIWLHFYEEALISKCLIAISDIHVYLNNLLKLNSNIHSRQTKYCNFNLKSPRIIAKQKEEELLPSQLAKAWNSLPLPLRQKDSVDSFKKALWNEFFTQQQTLDYFSF